MNKKILVLNVEISGMNKFLLAQLTRHGWKLAILNVPFPRWCKLKAIILSFAPNWSKWRKQYNETLSQIYKSSAVFRQRARYCQKKIAELKEKFDLIFQISGMFAPATDPGHARVPYVTYNDYTVALSCKYPRWAPPENDIRDWLMLEKQLYQQARFIFTTNDNARLSIMNDYEVPMERVATVGYGLNFSNVPGFKKNIHNRDILFVGNDFERKGGPNLLKAFAKIHRTFSDSRLIIIGPSQETHHIEQDGVQFLGHMADRAKLQEFYRNSFIFAMPSVCEPFGLVFLEAMAYQMITIGSRVDAMPEIIDHGQTGFLVKPDCPDEIVDLVTQIFNDPRKYQGIGPAAAKKVFNNYSWDNVGDKIDTSLRAILKK